MSRWIVPEIMKMCWTLSKLCLKYYWFVFSGHGVYYIPFWCWMPFAGIIPDFWSTDAPRWRPSAVWPRYTSSSDGEVAAVNRRSLIASRKAVKHDQRASERRPRTSGCWCCCDRDEGSIPVHTDSWSAAVRTQHVYFTNKEDTPSIT